jgi:hypothetical protein
MSQTMTDQDAGCSGAGVGAKRSGKVAVGQPKRARATSRRARIKPLVRVPMLDWPSDLFCDNMTVAELMAEDVSVRWDHSGPPHHQHLLQTHLKAAA